VRIGADEFLKFGLEFSSELRSIKRQIDPPSPGWYPHESLSSLPILAELISPLYDEIAAGIGDARVADIGCADGDFALLLVRCGFPVDAIDHAPNNFNQMRGVRKLVDALAPQVETFDIDLDGRFDLPRREYGLTLFLGTLYHLKNPYYALEKLAFHTHWCILSTRIAQVTPRVDASIDREPVAYLADGLEIENDSTNYWIFSAAGLLRILQRTRWAIRAVKRTGCLVDSNPIVAEADERMFVVLQSRVYYPALHVRTASGWHEIEQDAFRWTAKSFALEIVLPLEIALSEFRLSMHAPDVLVAGGNEVRITCHIGREICGSMTVNYAGPFEFRGTLPPCALHEPVLRLEFTVISSFAGDDRELGICVPLEPGGSATSRIPFIVS
jgi:tRNA (mo5U34)-methyltransferase